jgi:Tfp pilus assembly ATPase PilU
MQTGTESGMQTMNQALFNLYQKQLVSYDEIFSRTMDPKELLRMTKGGL